ncbi:TerD family protein [Streptomyces sp. NBC_00620]|uniref:TerD family protein n=1 Tax=Streptomyces sp. NBC_00620 TaxID=2903666 RepID=UPI002258EE62|nr:TerD family protein [Streptomyces sp. NBC_00620]MCX4974454.1 TerD family protein [Streptomyces sp. NBC_00620]
MTHIIKGANIPVPAGLLRVAVCRRNVPGTPSVDASALLLDAVGRVRGDADLVFFNQPAHPSGAVRHAGNGEGGGQLAEWLELDLPRIEPAVQRVLIAGSCDGGVFGAVPGLAVQALAGDGAVVAHYEVTDASSETAFVLGEFYRRNGEWKFRAVGQGYASGLAGLATDFGIVVAEPVAPVVRTDISKTSEPPPATVISIPSPAQAPAQAPAPGSLGADFAPYAQSGRGNGVVSVDVPLPPGPVIVEIRVLGDDYLSVETLDHRNKRDRLVFNTLLPDFHGRALVQPPQDRPLRLNVDYSGAWTVTVLPLSAARPLGTAKLTGRGADVLAYTGTAADVKVRFDGGADRELFQVNLHEATHLDDLSRHDLIVNEIGRLKQTVPVPDGPLLIVVENAEGNWELTAKPLPVRNPSAGQKTGVYEGRGHKTITLVNPRPGRPALVRYDFPGAKADYSLEVKTVDEYGDEDNWFTGRERGTRGTALLFADGRAEQPVRIGCSGEWTLRLLPEEEAPLLTGPAEGVGSTVLRYQGPPTLMTVQRTSRGDNEHLSAWAVNHPYGKSVSIADTLGRRRPTLGPVWVDPGGTCFVSVRAAEGTKWRLEPAPIGAAPVLGARTPGGWYGVVRHTGPEVEMVPVATGLIHVFELDENLFPHRHITASSGPYRISSSFLHVRSLGEWTIELRG